MMNSWAEFILLWTAVSVLAGPVIGRVIAAGQTHCSACDWDWAGGEASWEAEEQSDDDRAGGLLEGEGNEYAK